MRKETRKTKGDRHCVEHALPQPRKPTASWEKLGTVEEMMDGERDDAKSGDAAEDVARKGEEFRSGEEARAKRLPAPRSPSKMEWEM